MAVLVLMHDAYRQEQRKGERGYARRKETPDQKVEFGCLICLALASARPAGAVAERKRESADQKDQPNQQWDPPLRKPVLLPFEEYAESHQLHGDKDTA